MSQKTVGLGTRLRVCLVDQYHMRTIIILNLSAGTITSG